MESITKNKKGQIQGLSTNIIALGVAAIVLVIMVVILQSLNGIDVIAKANSASATNESIASITNGQTITLAGVASPGCSSSIVTVTNATNSKILGAGNYTDGSSTCSITSTADASYNNSAWKITYSYTYGDEAFTTTNDTIIGVGTFADFWTIIVLAIVAAVVLGIIFGLFGAKGKER